MTKRIRCSRGALQLALVPVATALWATLGACSGSVATESAEFENAAVAAEVRSVAFSPEASRASRLSRSGCRAATVSLGREDGAPTWKRAERRGLDVSQPLPRRAESFNVALRGPPAHMFHACRLQLTEAHAMGIMRILRKRRFEL